MPANTNELAPPSAESTNPHTDTQGGERAALEAIEAMMGTKGWKIYTSLLDAHISMRRQVASAPLSFESRLQQLPDGKTVAMPPPHPMSAVLMQERIKGVLEGVTLARGLCSQWIESMRAETAKRARPAPGASVNGGEERAHAD